PGVGGHCIAVDPWFIVDSAPEDSDLIRAARKVNDAKPHHLAERVIAAAREQTAPVIACLGLAYKADIDDLRQSPAVTITRLLAEAGAGEILAVEPHVGSLPPELDAAPGVTLADLNEALARADIVVLLVDHKDFKELDPARLSDKQVFDARGIWR
ncbi:MAG: UDP-N-acetyl-D-mannosamine dehydrogenase, partial [Alphaproteobacteria bacterium]|nr:UDP-N-acetyl-D-mannosamine dehydrogenase [Alphaproteobacteria bacterium]